MAQYIYHNEWPAWEVDPSTRTATHPFTRYYPFKVTLSSTNTAQDILSVDRGNAGVNLVTNPSVEHATISEFTAIGEGPAALSQSSAQASHGSNSLLVNPDGDAGEGFYTVGNVGKTPDANTSSVLAQCEVRGGSSGDVVIKITKTDGTVLATGTQVTLSTSWQALKVSYKLPSAIDYTQVHVRVMTATNHDRSFYVDKIHNEIRGDGSFSSYIDGAQGLQYEWTGTANLSISKKRVGITAIRGIRLHTSHDTWLAFDATASSSTGIWIGDPAAANPQSGFFESTHPLDFRTNVSFVNGTGSETPTVYGVIWGVHSG